MEKINITAIQLCAKIGDKHYNFKKVEEYISKNSQTDVIVLPEVWSIGWDCTKFQHNAEDLEKSETLRFLSTLAEKYNVNIIGGSIITQKAECFYNTCTVFNRLGELVATYNKNHLYSYYGSEESKYLSVGKNPVIVNLDGIKYGLTIYFFWLFCILLRSVWYSIRISHRVQDRYDAKCCVRARDYKR